MKKIFIMTIIFLNVISNLCFAYIYHPTDYFPYGVYSSGLDQIWHLSKGIAVFIIIFYFCKRFFQKDKNIENRKKISRKTILISLLITVSIWVILEAGYLFNYKINWKKEVTECLIEDLQEFKKMKSGTMTGKKLKDNLLEVYPKYVTGEEKKLGEFTFVLEPLETNADRLERSDRGKYFPEYYKIREIEKKLKIRFVDEFGIETVIEYSNITEINELIEENAKYLVETERDEEGYIYKINIKSIE